MTKPSKVAQRPSRRLGARAHSVAKAGRGRTATEFTPLRVSGHGIVVDEKLRLHISRRLGTLLGRFATQITGVTVRFRDLSGPTGAPTRACAIRATVIGNGPLLVSVAAPDERSAFEAAATSIARTAGRLLARKRARRR